MDEASGVDEDFIKIDHDISAPLDVRRLQGNARCTNCKESGRECFLERRATGRHRCLTCASDEDCQFRRAVVKEAPAYRFTWEQLTHDHTPTTDAAGPDATRKDKRLKRKQSRSITVDAPHSHDATDTASNWPQAESTRISYERLTKSSVTDQHRVLLAPKLKRLCSTFTKEQARLIHDLYQLCPPEANKDLCFLKSVLDATNKMQRHYDITSLTSEPASQLRTNISFTPYPPQYFHNEQYQDDSLSFVPPSYDAFDDIGHAGDWALPIPGSMEYLQPYAPGATSVIDRQTSVFHDLSDVSTQFGDVQPFPAPTFGGRLDLGDPASHILEPTPAKRDTSIVPKLSTDPASEIPDVSLPFKCNRCGEMLNTRSEFRKHMARHTKPFVCTVLGCSRATDGFATRNDLDRHIASIHDTNHAFKMYKCAVPGCKDPTKLWARKDNFKAHIKRMHPEANPDEYLEKSVVEPRDASKDEG